jgi:uncharacterized cupredoxin-like copper-binding protein
MHTTPATDARAVGTPRRGKRARAALAALAVAGLVPALAACGDDDDDTATEAADAAEETETGGGLSSATDGAQEIEVTVPGGEDGEFAFEADLEGLTAGPVTVTLTNNGTLEHQAMLLRLNEGESVDTFVAASVADPSGLQALGLVEGFGGPNGVGPGETRASTQVVEEGDYMLICVIPDDAGVPHAGHGMVMPFAVAPADGGATVEPVVDDPADADVTLVDFGFQLNGDFAPGQDITIGNSGEQAHELAIYRLSDGSSAEDAEAWLADPEAGGPPPFSPAGGIGALAPGGSAQLTLPEEPGDYVVVCFLPDVAGDAKPHHTHGMVAGLTLG